MSERGQGIALPGQYLERGVVLHSLKYSERQLVVHMLTRGRGRVSYITNISKSGGGLRGARRNIFQPLFVLEFQANSTSGSMGRLSQCEAAVVLHNIPMDIVKSSVAMFVSELLYRVVREPMDDPRMYDFVESSVVGLDLMESGVANFHLWFLVHMAYFMGYGFSRGYRDGDWLDIQSGEYQSSQPVHRYRIAPQYASVIDRLNGVGIEDLGGIGLNRTDRVTLLSALTDYYLYHCDLFGGIRSLEVLRELF